MASAVDNSSPTGSPAASGASSPKHIPVAREVQVIATGARPGDGSQKRELFTEATGTVLISEIGGVIRLSAAVATGQLLYLTNRQSQREVVAQVIRKRSFRPTSCYVELEFTEPAPGFWGPPEILTEAAEPVAPSAQTEAREMVQSAEPTDERQDSLKIAPSALDVERLKNEVETLRHQGKPLPPIDPGDGNRAGANRAAEEKLFSAKAEPSSTRTLPKLKLPTELPAPATEPAFSEEDLLPKPSLDFSQMPAKLNNSAGSSIGMRSLRILKMVAVILIVATGVAWFMNMIPGVPTPNSLFARTKPAVPVRAASGAGPSAGAPQKKTDGGDQRDASQENVTPAAQTSEDSATSSQAMTPAAETKSAEPPAEENNSQLSAKKNTAVPVRAAEAVDKRTPVETHPAANFADVAPKMPPRHGPLTPPKLLQKVRPVAPPEAIRGYVTGNVDLDVLVDETGQVKSAKVTAGADVLRAAAVNTVKQYKYQPAMQDGRPVAAHTSVTVQFWYEP